MNEIMNDEPYYEAVSTELLNKQIKPALWTKAYAESCGNESLAKSLYIKLRVKELREAVTQQQHSDLRNAITQARNTALTAFGRFVLYFAGIILGFLGLSWNIGGFIFLSQENWSSAVSLLIFSVPAIWGCIKCFKKAREGLT